MALKMALLVSFAMIILIQVVSADRTTTDLQLNSNNTIKIEESPIAFGLLSESGIGKSALGNVLLGHKPNRTGGLNGCFTGNKTL